jgi:hypothetical protein
MSKPTVKTKWHWAHGRQAGGREREGAGAHAAQGWKLPLPDRPGTPLRLPAREQGISTYAEGATPCRVYPAGEDGGCSAKLTSLGTASTGGFLPEPPQTVNIGVPAARQLQRALYGYLFRFVVGCHDRRRPAHLSPLTCRIAAG